MGYLKRDWETLLAAYSSLRLQTNLKLVGGTGKVDLPESAQAQKIECLPYVPINQLKEIIARASLVALPLPYQLYSFGQMTLLQAMAMGKAVIVSNVPGIADYVQDGKNAILVRPYDYLEMRDKMEYWLTHPQERKTIGMEARKSIEEKFNEKNMAEGIFGSCMELLGYQSEKKTTVSCPGVVKIQSSKSEVDCDN
ncbi:hypothetical protein A2W24_04455 [Microgenomates group bacterium RBG_16_45_19]|nr:MAG: hypothetical protein A2W24_04455 [Microgenomates group bacterium RBG_16_45_19]